MNLKIRKITWRFIFQAERRICWKFGNSRSHRSAGAWTFTPDSLWTGRVWPWAFHFPQDRSWRNWRRKAAARDFSVAAWKTETYPAISAAPKVRFSAGSGTGNIHGKILPWKFTTCSHAPSPGCFARGR